MKKIALCVCTFKRVSLLNELMNSFIKTIEKFYEDYSDGEFNVQIIVLDNDELKSAKPIISDYILKYPFVNYYSEVKNGLVRARNKCLEIVIKEGYDYFTFIDDDEYVGEDWLLNMYNCLIKNDANIVFGKIETVYPANCPDWIIRGKFFEKSNYKNGQKNIISATANVMIDSSIIIKEKEFFNIDFNKTGGEDTYFFKFYLKKGYQSVWCQEGVVYDRVLKERLYEKYIYLRAYTASHTYSYIQQMTGEEKYLTSFIKGVIKASFASFCYLFFFLGKKEKKVFIMKLIYSGLGRTMIKKINRY